MTVWHGRLLQSLQSSVRRSGIVTSRSVDIVRSVNRNKEMKLALINKSMERDEKGERVNGDTIGGDSDKKRDRLRKGGDEGSLGVQEFKRVKIRRGRGGRRGESSRHRRREGWEDRGDRSSTKNNALKLNSREKWKAVGGEIGDEVDG